MSVRRVVPNLAVQRTDGADPFYVRVLGLEKSMDMDWIVTYTSSQSPAAQVTLLSTDPSGLRPDLSVEVSDVDAVHARAVEAGFEIVYPLTDEPWGVRRFFVREPGNRLVNVMMHRGESAGMSLTADSQG